MRYKLLRWADVSFHWLEFRGLLRSKHGWSWICDKWEDANNDRPR